MGEVWEGVHETLGTRVAIKFIDAELAESREARQRFENEARAAARLQSKYVVSVYDHGMLPDGRPYIVMEYLEGEALDKKLDREGRLCAEDTVMILGHVAGGLMRAHAAGIVHRDLKPENVFIVRDDEDGAGRRSRARQRQALPLQQTYAREPIDPLDRMRVGPEPAEL